MQYYINTHRPWGWLAACLIAVGLIAISSAATQAAEDKGWVRAIGSGLSEEARAVAVDNAGNVYFTGAYQGVVDFDPGSGVAERNSGDHSAIFIVKLTPEGNLAWAESLPSSQGARANDIAVDRHGNVYLTGEFSGDIDLDPDVGVESFTSEGEEDIFVLKLDTIGNFVWSEVVGSSGSDGGFGIAADYFGTAYVTGSYEETVDFGQGALGDNVLSSEGADDAFLARYTTNGDMVWAKSFGGDEDDEGRSVALDGAGNIYIAGIFEDTIDLDPGFTDDEFRSKGREDIFVAKYVQGGNWVWSATFGGLGEEVMPSLAVDGIHDVYITGSFERTVDFDPHRVNVFDLTTRGEEDIFLAKLSGHDGHFIWAKSFGAGLSDFGEGIAIDNTNKVFLTGGFEQTVDFDPGAGETFLTSAGQDDIFLAQFDHDGNLLDARAMSGAQDEEARDIAVDMAGNIYVVGEFQGVVEFDVDLFATNATQDQYDLFVVKLARDLSQILAFDYLPNIQR